MCKADPSYLIKLREREEALIAEAKAWGSDGAGDSGSSCSGSENEQHVRLHGKLHW